MFSKSIISTKILNMYGLKLHTCLTPLTDQQNLSLHLLHILCDNLIIYFITSNLSCTAPESLPIDWVQQFSIIFKTIVQMAYPDSLAFVYSGFSNKNIIHDSFTLDKD